MVERAPIDPKIYLDRHLEPSIPEKQKITDALFANTSLLGPGFEYQYKDTNEFSEQVKNRKVSFSTVVIDGEFKSQLQQIANARGKRNVARRLLSGNQPVHLIRHLEIEDLSRGTKLELGGSKPEESNPMVLLRVRQEPGKPWDEREQNFATNNLIVVEGDLTKLGTVATLYHELGHLRNNDHPIMGEEAHQAVRNKFRGPILPTQIDDETAAVILEDERRAWAYALQQLKTVLTREELQLTINHLHHHALDSYSETMRKRLENGWLVKFSTWLEKIFPTNR